MSNEISIKEYFEKQMDDFKKSNDEAHSRIEDKLDRFIDSADKKYAPAWAGDFVKALICLCLLAVAYFILHEVGLPIPPIH